MKGLLVIVVFSACMMSYIKAQCTPGTFYAEGKIKFECLFGGVKAVGCLPNGQLGDLELTPGQTHSTSAFHFQCISKDDNSVSYEVIACIVNGNIIQVGEEIGVPDKGLYVCTRNADGSVGRKYTPGCHVDGKVYKAGQTWDDGESRIICKGLNGRYSAEATGCIHNGILYQLGTFGEENGKFFKCQGNSSNLFLAALITIEEQEYRQLVGSDVDSHEEHASGDHGAGFTLPPTTTEPTTLPSTTEKPTEETTEPIEDSTTIPTTTPEPIADETTTPIPTAAEDSTYITSEAKPEITTVPTTTEIFYDYTTKFIVDTTEEPKNNSKPVIGECQDSHPICKTLCSKPCSGQDRSGSSESRESGGKHSKSGSHEKHGHHKAGFRAGYRAGYRKLSGSASKDHSGSGEGRGHHGGKSKHHHHGSHSADRSRSREAHGNGEGRPHGPAGRPHGSSERSHESFERPHDHLTAASIDLLEAFCPKSCGACGKKIDLEKSASSFSSAVCDSQSQNTPKIEFVTTTSVPPNTSSAPVGRPETTARPVAEVRPSTKRPISTPKPPPPPTTRPSKGKGKGSGSGESKESKGKKSKNKSGGKGKKGGKSK